MDNRYYLNIDLDTQFFNPKMRFSKNLQVPCFFIIELTDKHKPIPNLDKIEVILNVIKPDKTFDSQLAEYKDNLLYFSLKPSLRDIEGLYRARLEFTLDGIPITTDLIKYQVGNSYSQDSENSLSYNTGELSKRIKALEDALINNNTDFNKDLDILQDAFNDYKDIANERLDSLTTDYSEFKNDVFDDVNSINSNMNNIQSSVTKNINNMQTSLNSFKQNINSQVTDLNTTLDNSINNLTNDINVTKRYVDAQLSSFNISLDNIQLESNLRLDNIEDNISNLDSVESRITDLESENSSLLNKINSLTLEQDTINTELDTLDKNIIETKRNLDTTNTSLNNYKEITNAQLDSLSQSLTHTQDIFSSELNNLNNVHFESIKRLDSLEENNVSINDNVNNINTSLESFKDSTLSHISSINDNLVNYQNQTDSLLNSHSESLDELTSSLNSIQSDISKLEESNDRLAHLENFEDSISKEVDSLATNIELYKNTTVNEIVDIKTTISTHLTDFDVKFNDIEVVLDEHANKITNQSNEFESFNENITQSITQLNDLTNVLSDKVNKLEHDVLDDRNLTQNLLNDYHSYKITNDSKVKSLEDSITTHNSNIKFLCDNYDNLSTSIDSLTKDTIELGTCQNDLENSLAMHVRYSDAKFKVIDDSIVEHKEVVDKSLEEHLTNTNTHLESMYSKIDEFESDLIEFENSKADNIFHASGVIINPIGGIKEGTNLDGLSIQDVLMKLLYPYTKPIINGSVAYTPSGSVFEVGSSVNISNISVNIIKQSEPITKIELYRGDTLIGLLKHNIADGGVFNFNLNPPYNINTSINLSYFHTVVYDSMGSTTVNLAPSLTFVSPYYYGVSDGNTSITSLSKLIQTKGTKSIKFSPNNQSVIFAYPREYGKLKSILDSNGFEILNSFSISELYIKGLDNNTRLYYIYTSEPFVGDNFKITFYY